MVGRSSLPGVGDVRCMQAETVSAVRDDPRLVVRRPDADSTCAMPVDQVCIGSESAHDSTAGPAAQPILQGGGKVPLVEGGGRLYAPLDQAIDQAVIEGQAFRAGGA